MSCLAHETITRLATTGERDAHLGDCLHCRRAYHAECELRTTLRALPPLRLSSDRRRALAAELLAHTRALHPARRARTIVAAVAAFASAAAVALVVARAPDRARAAPAVELAAFEDTAIRSASVAPAELARPGARIDARAARAITARDVITLLDGTLEVDATGARPAEIVVGETRVRVDDASVRVRARRGTVISVQVIVGAAELRAPGYRITLARDSLWQPGPSAAERSARAFADAWVALRAGDHRTAIALFDRATDAAVAEDAAYWAAIAADRAGDRDEAARRFAAFVATYPRSPYADRAAIAAKGSGGDHHE